MSEIFHGDDPGQSDDGLERDAETATARRASDSERERESSQSQRVRELNDRFRRTMMGGTVLFTAGVNTLSFEQKDRIMAAIRAFDDFNEGNDPWGQHDFGAVEIDGQKVWFKIDVYDVNHEYGSPDPTDPRVSRRVMTVLLPDEY